MTYKLLALDMDGTLLNDKKIISDQNRIWIRQAVEAGITVCMATGRGRPNIVPFLQQLELDTPFVAVNGSEVWADSHNLRSRQVIEPELIRQMHRLADGHDTWYWAYGSRQVYTKSNWIDNIESEIWMKFGIYTEHLPTLTALTEEIASWGKLEMTNSDPLNIEMNPLGISKATGLREVCELVGCQFTEMIAAGDSLNDEQMIRAAGLGVAMGNAQQAVKDEADLVIPSNEEDGIAYLIKNYILNG